MAKKGNFALGALIGAAAGIIAGVLAAPKSGKETRADLRQKADDIKKDAAGRSADMKSKATDAAESARRKVESTVEDVKGRADDMKRRANSAANAAKTELKKDDESNSDDEVRPPRKTR